MELLNISEKIWQIGFFFSFFTSDASRRSIFYQYQMLCICLFLLKYIKEVKRFRLFFQHSSVIVQDKYINKFYLWEQYKNLIFYIFYLLYKSGLKMNQAVEVYIPSYRGCAYSTNRVYSILFIISSLRFKKWLNSSAYSMSHSGLVR